MIWREQGTEKMTSAQQRMLNAVCGDLEKQVTWHGFRLSKADWRHFLSGTELGWRTIPGIDQGDGRPTVVMLGGSSLDLSKTQATNAIGMAIAIGDDPSSQGLSDQPVRWSDAVLHGLGFDPKELAA